MFFKGLQFTQQVQNRAADLTLPSQAFLADQIVLFRLKNNHWELSATVCGRFFLNQSAIWKVAIHSACTQTGFFPPQTPEQIVARNSALSGGNFSPDLQSCLFPSAKFSIVVPHIPLRTWDSTPSYFQLDSNFPSFHFVVFILLTIVQVIWDSGHTFLRVKRLTAPFLRSPLPCT